MTSTRRPFFTSAAALQITTGQTTEAIAARTFPHCQRARHDLCPFTSPLHGYRCACACHTGPADAGKSAIVRDIAAQTGAPVIDLPMSHVAPTVEITK